MSLSIPFTAYIDGIRQPETAGGAPENRRPLGSGIHYNVYQSQGPGLFFGTSIGGANTHNDDADIDEAGDDFFYPGGISHGELDDEDPVQDELIDNLIARIGQW